MRKFLLLLSTLCCLAGCGTLQDLHTNMLTTNEKMEENIVVLSNVREKVLENQVQVDRSTEQVKHFQGVNASNMMVVKKTMAISLPFQAGKLATLGLLLLLVVPCIMMGLFYSRLKRK